MDMEEPITVQDKVKDNHGNKPQPQKKTQAPKKVEMVYMRKN